MLFTGFFLFVMSVMNCEIVSGGLSLQKTTSSRLSKERKMELVFNSVSENLYTVFNDHATTSFLNRTLDETLTLFKNKPLLNTINAAVRIIAEKLADKELTEHMLHGLTMVDNFFTNAEYHKLVKDSIELYYMAITDPAALEMAERVLVELQHMKGDKMKVILKDIVDHLGKEREMQRTLDGMALGVQSFSAMISNPGASQQIIKALNWVSNPETNSVNAQQTKAPPTRTISIRPRPPVRIDSRRHPIR
uniref:Uncharacterized protein n=1 Tax=Cacopsylla melanoneura TaxID=428564 RepID=A0A8D8XKF6_9HEMI